MGKLKSTKYVVKFDILKTEQIAAAQSGFDGRAIGDMAALAGVFSGSWRGAQAGTVAGRGIGSVQSNEATSVWVIGMRYKIINAETTEQLAQGYTEEKIWLVINRASMTGGIARRDIEERLHVRVRHTIPDDQPLVSMAVNRGVPLIMSHERSAVGKAMKELATLMINDAKGERDPAVAVAATLQALTNPFQRLLHRVRPVESRSA